MTAALASSNRFAPTPIHFRSSDPDSCLVIGDRGGPRFARRRGAPATSRFGPRPPTVPARARRRKRHRAGAPRGAPGRCAGAGRAAMHARMPSSPLPASAPALPARGGAQPGGARRPGTGGSCDGAPKATGSAPSTGRSRPGGITMARRDRLAAGRRSRWRHRRPFPHRRVASCGCPTSPPIRAPRMQGSASIGCSIDRRPAPRPAHPCPPGSVAARYARRSQLGCCYLEVFGSVVSDALPVLHNPSEIDPAAFARALDTDLADVRPPPQRVARRSGRRSIALPGGTPARAVAVARRMRVPACRRPDRPLYRRLRGGSAVSAGV